MHQTGLIDLEDLALTVRDRNSRSYISEAISAYRAQAFRAAILSVWTAVAYDIFSKIRELDGQGEKEAKQFTTELDNAIEQHSKSDATALRKLQQIENDLLQTARERFELLSRREMTDLERLKEDRNLCAHPAFTGQTLLFQPSAEAVRAHIVHAVVHLLQHPPVQGKSALQRFKQDLLQDSFPSEPTAVLTFLENRYLRRLKAGLLKNFVSVLTKQVMTEVDPELRGRGPQVLACLSALRTHSPSEFESSVRELLSRLADDLKDPDLKRVLRLLRVDNRVWTWLTDTAVIRLKNLVAIYKFDNGDSDYLFDGFVVPELADLLLESIGKLAEQDKIALLTKYPRPEFKSIAIDLYASSPGWRSAEERAKDLILPLTQYFTANDIGRITQAIATNSQIYEAHRSPTLILDLFLKTKHLHAKTRIFWESAMIERLAMEASFSGLSAAMTAAGMTVAVAERQAYAGGSGEGIPF